SDYFSIPLIEDKITYETFNNQSLEGAGGAPKGVKNVTRSIVLSGVYYGTSYADILSKTTILYDAFHGGYGDLLLPYETISNAKCVDISFDNTRKHSHLPYTIRFEQTVYESPFIGSIVLGVDTA